MVRRERDNALAAAATRAGLDALAAWLIGVAWPPDVPDAAVPASPAWAPTDRPEPGRYHTGHLPLDELRFPLMVWSGEDPARSPRPPRGGRADVSPHLTWRKQDRATVRAQILAHLRTDHFPRTLNRFSIELWDQNANITAHEMPARALADLVAEGLVAWGQFSDAWGRERDHGALYFQPNNFPVPGAGLHVFRAPPGVSPAGGPADDPWPEQIRQQPPRPAPRVAEAFAGGGLYALALRAEGWEAAERCELNPAAVATLQLHYGGTPICDAMEWTPPTGLDLLTGGPPCQPWTNAGDMRGPDDPRNFYPRLVRWIRDSQPRVFAWENSAKVATVPRYQAYFRDWWAQVRAVGYEGTTWVLNAADYGSPQARLRAWTVGWPVGSKWGELLGTPPPLTHGRPGSAAVEAGQLLPWTRAFDRIIGGCCGRYGLHDCRNTCNYSGACETCVGVMGELPANYAPASRVDASELSAEAQAYLARHKRARPRVLAHPPIPGAAEAWDELDIDDPRVTGYLSPATVANLRRGVPYGLIATDETPRLADVDRDSPEQMAEYLGSLRRLSPRTAARLMDVPNWYDFAGSQSAAYQQIGNGITVNMGRAVARHVLQALGRATPLPGSPSAQGRWGLWPIDAVDPCARFPGIQGYPGTHWVGSVPEKADFDPFARPLPDRRAWEASRETQARALEATARWTNGYEPDPNWRPSSAQEPPPGFPDFPYFLQWLSGESPETIAYYRPLYAAVGGTLPKFNQETDDGIDHAHN